MSLLFEDSEGLFHNRDSLGNDIDLGAGDLYWLKAGSGAVHDEYPRERARAHGLQVFVNLPHSQRFDAPDSLLVRSKEMPVINGASYRVKLALGQSNGVTGAISPSVPMTVLDGIIDPGGRFSHDVTPNNGLWVQAIEGSLDIAVGDEVCALTRGRSLALRADGAASITLGNPSRQALHFVVFDGESIGETYVQDGPFVTGSKEQIAEIKAAYVAGRLGRIDDIR